MNTLEELIGALLPLLPEAEVSVTDEGEIVVYTGLTAPNEASHGEVGKVQERKH